MNLQDTIKVSRLLDMYGVLLTDKQKQILNSYVNYNGSISEIAEEFGTTRQAVLDLLKRTIAKLEEYESKLKFSSKLDNIYSKFSKISNQCSLTKEQQKIIMELIKTMED